MSRKKRQAGHVNHERWLVSYADFITLLFAFFVVLYSSSQVDKRKVGQISQAIQAAFQQLGVFPDSNKQLPILDSPGSIRPSLPIPELDDQESKALKQMGQKQDPSPKPGLDAKRLMRELEEVLAPEIKKQEIRVHDGPDGVVLSLQEVGFYDPGSDQLRPGAYAILGRLAPILSGYGSELRIEGHTDDVPIHNARFASNWELSAGRATGLVRLFVDRYGFEPQRLSVSGYSEYHPVASNSTPEGRQMNRRVDIVILPARKPSVPRTPAAPDPKTVAHAIASQPR
jgi:chemotaxis protein MotB